MKSFEPFTFDVTRCKNDLDDFNSLLAAGDDLTERKHILPFFKRHPHLSAFVGSCVFHLVSVDRLAYEFSVFGDFSADLAVGDSARGVYCLVEFEHATAESIFRKVRNKSTREWSPRFEHGFSQLVDWFFKIDDMRGSQAFGNLFGAGQASFFGILVTGRSEGLSDYERARFEWRKQRVLIDSKPVLCLTFDDLYDQLRARLENYELAYRADSPSSKS